MSLLLSQLGGGSTVSGAASLQATSAFTAVVGGRGRILAVLAGISAFSAVGRGRVLILALLQGTSALSANIAGRLRTSTSMQGQSSFQGMADLIGGGIKKLLMFIGIRI